MHHWNIFAKGRAISSPAAAFPLLVLFGVLAGEKIAGIPGMFFSVPVIAALRILFLEMTKPEPVDPIVADESCDS